MKKEINHTPFTTVPVRQMDQTIEGLPVLRDLEVLSVTIVETVGISSYFVWVKTVGTEYLRVAATGVAPPES
jgi:hypothetical protein